MRSMSDGGPGTPHRSGVEGLDEPGDLMVEIRRVVERLGDLREQYLSEPLAQAVCGHHRRALAEARLGRHPAYEMPAGRSVRKTFSASNCAVLPARTAT